MWPVWTNHMNYTAMDCWITKYMLYRNICCHSKYFVTGISCYSAVQPVHNVTEYRIIMMPTLLSLMAQQVCSLQNKIWNLPDRSTILPKFIYDKEGKLAGPTKILPVRVRGPALILKTGCGPTASMNNQFTMTNQAGSSILKEPEQQSLNHITKLSFKKVN